MPATTAAPTPALAGCTLELHGRSVPAAVAGDHLSRHGAAVHRWTGGGALPQAAVHAADAEAGLRWSHPEAVGACSADALGGLVAVDARRHGAPRILALDVLGVAHGIGVATGALASRLRGGAPMDVSAERQVLQVLAQYLAGAAAGGDAPPPCGGPGSPLRTADGHWLELETLDPDAWRAFWAAFAVDRVAVGDGWRSFVLRYATADAPLPAALHDALAGVPLARVRELGAQARVSVVPLDAHPADPQGEPWHTAPAERPDDRPRAGAAGAAPLAGLRVVDLGRRIQGPLAAHALRLLGAHVDRVEPPGGDPLRLMEPAHDGCSARFRALNDGKRVYHADLRRDAGRRTVLELAAGADVVVHNLAPGRDAQLGIAPADLRRAAPGLICAVGTGWGVDPPPHAPLGTDFAVQAATGVTSALGRDAAGRPAASLVTILDVLGGLLAAEAIVGALVARERDRHPRTVTSSLAGAAATLLAHGRRASGVRTTPFGALPTAVALPTADGAVVVERDRDRPCGAGARALGPADAIAPPARGRHGAGSRGGSATVEQRAAWRDRRAPTTPPDAALLDHSSAAVVERLAAAGVAATAIRTELPAVLADPWLADAWAGDPPGLTLRPPIIPRTGG